MAVYGPMALIKNRSYFPAGSRAPACWDYIRCVRSYLSTAARHEVRFFDALVQLADVRPLGARRNLILHQAATTI